MTDDRLLITGAEGFVGGHVLRALTGGRLAGATIGAFSHTSRVDGEFGAFGGLDITQQASIDAAIAAFQPTHILHLAGISATTGDDAWQRALWETNTFGPLNIVNAIKRLAPACHFIFIGSGLVYGDSAASGLAVDETAALAPNNAYAVTKAAADLALGAEPRSGVKITRLRPFNHTGPGQTEAFVIPRFAAQIARCEAGLQPPLITTGDLSAERDYLDVVDAVDAYIRVIERSETLPPGLILNIASGRPRCIRDVLDQLVAMSRVELTVVSAAATTPAGPPSRYAGDARLARRLLDWAPSRDFDATLRDVLDHWRRIYVV